MAGQMMVSLGLFAVVKHLMLVSMIPIRVLAAGIAQMKPQKYLKNTLRKVCFFYE
jgi:hypothetical protein